MARRRNKKYRRYKSKASRVRSTKRPSLLRSIKRSSVSSVASIPKNVTKQKKYRVYTPDAIQAPQKGLKLISNLFPNRVSDPIKTCRRRNARKQVLFAKKLNGTNGMKKRKFTERSKIKC
jgi:hypothetical protein